MQNVNNTTKEFIDEIDPIIKESYSEIRTALNNCKANIYNFTFGVDISNDILKKYSLNDSITITVDASMNECNVRYHYNLAEIKPVCYYIRPDDYTEV